MCSRNFDPNQEQEMCGYIKFSILFLSIFHMYFYTCIVIIGNDS